MTQFGDEIRLNVEPWFSVEDIAQHLGVSKETIYRWLDRKQIPAHRLGKLWKFKPTEVDNWIKRGEATEFPASRQGG